jgi:Excinuclease ATPase subunit
MILVPYSIGSQEGLKLCSERWLKSGYLRAYMNDELVQLDDVSWQTRVNWKQKNDLLLVVDRLAIKPSVKKRLEDSIRLGFSINSKEIVAEIDGKRQRLAEGFVNPETAEHFPALTPKSFAFNLADGFCPHCQGLGVVLGADLQFDPSIQELSPLGLLADMWDLSQSGRAVWTLLRNALSDVDLRKSFKTMIPEMKTLIFKGTKEKAAKGFQWRGIDDALEDGMRFDDPLRQMKLRPWLEERQCPSCFGARLNPLSRSVRLGGLTLPDICFKPLEALLTWFKDFSHQQTAQQKYIQDLLSEVIARLRFLESLGLGYLTLDRGAPTLSGGELQRVRLARQLGSELTEVLYLLGEPTRGLHPKDLEPLFKALNTLKERGNTLVVVDHHDALVNETDWLIEMGPQSGKLGGEIVYAGQPNAKKYEELQGKSHLKTSVRKPKGWIKLSHQTCHNLVDLSVSIPRAVFTVVAGVSGSGKSTLIDDCLIPQIKKALNQEKTQDLQGLEGIDQLIVLNQEKSRFTSRSDISTYTDLLTPIREFFAKLPKAQSMGLEPKHFSTNHQKGMCTECQGHGMKTVEMHFLPPVLVLCEACKGLRLNPLSLEVTYQGKNLGQLLKMSLSELAPFFAAFPKLVRRFDSLLDLGLGYLALGQELTTLSSGEVQRLRIAKELAKRGGIETLYILDEPTAGLYQTEVDQLLKVIDRLVDKGNTVVVVEHHLAVMRHADWMIEMGPGAGVFGGKIVAEGTPKSLQKNSTSITGSYL